MYTIKHFKLLVVDIDQLLRPNTYIWIIVQTLFDHVKLPVLTRVITDSSTVEPVAIVTCYIVINLH